MDKDEPVTFSDDNHGASWQAIFHVGGYSFQAVKDCVATVARAVAQAETWDQMPGTWASGDGFRTLTFFSGRYRSPVEEQIKALRAKADEMERSLKVPAP